ncbi:unnamed protein product [Callosobruchus maculatus]|uniref:Uncharacterized protein n=1 Tax=Callosobruchus maculatus TaxID=64391 RepID=A0A653CNP6_CALMS|nr:unnamed protein product [Callosobruchus maculatus]
MNINVLIDEVFARPLLWKPKQKDLEKHHHKHMKYIFELEGLWNEVAAKLFTSRHAVRSKWKSLRNRFKHTLKTADPERYTGEWKYFYSLIFLKDQFMPTGPRAEDRWTSPRENQDWWFQPEFQISPESPNYDVEFPPLPVSSALTSSSTTEQSKRKRQCPLEVEDEESEQVKEKRTKCTEEDEDMNFFKSLLPHVRNLSPYEKIDYRLKIMKLTLDLLTPNQNISCHPTTTGSPNLELPSGVNGNIIIDSVYSLHESIKLESDTE